MSKIFSASLNNTDKRNNYADNCYNNTNDTHSNFWHQIMYLSLYFPFVPPPKIQEVLKMSNILAREEPLPV